MAIVGGSCNSNNVSRCGARYLNVNNLASRANWNYGASLSYSFHTGRYSRPNNVTVFPQPSLKINLSRGAASKRQPAHRREGNKKGRFLLKSHNGLYDAMMAHEEIKSAIVEAAVGKTKRSVVKRALADLDGKADSIAEIIESGRWKPPHHKRQTLKEGTHKKTRDIEKPQWDDEQIIHHMLMRQFRKIMVPKTYRYACGSMSGADEEAMIRRNPRQSAARKRKRKGRGPLFAVRTMVRWRDGYGGKKFYVAELDIKKFYDNVDLDILKAMLRRMIRDKRFLEVLFKVLDASAPGLPKGFYTSPWMGNFYLWPLDMFIVQTLKPDHYLRYMDNLYLFARSKKELHRMVREIEAFLWSNLRLELNGSKQIFRFEYKPKFAVKTKPRKKAVRPHGHKKNRKREDRGRAINALGYVIHRDRVTMRKSILERARAKANRMHRLRRCRRRDAASMLAYKGWFTHTDTYNYFQAWIKPKVSLRYCRKRLSVLAKREQERRKAA